MYAAKYIGTSEPTGVGGISMPCSIAMSEACQGATAHDPPSYAPPPKGIVPTGSHCWCIAGMTVIIDDTWESIMSGFEITNFNFHIPGTIRAEPNQFNLPGPMLSSSFSIGR